eukprot:2825244-Pyramimonas_sp.AAC.1
MHVREERRGGLLEGVGIQSGRPARLAVTGVHLDHRVRAYRRSLSLDLPFDLCDFPLPRRFPGLPLPGLPLPRPLDFMLLPPLGFLEGL